MNDEIQMSTSELCNLFRQARITTSSHRHLIRNDSITCILSRDRIRHLLQYELHLEPYNIEKYTDLVCERATKVLSILICIGHVGAFIDGFLHRDLFDNKLPLTSPDLPETICQAFLDEQQHFLAPIFANGVFKDWKSEVILPFSLDQPLEEAVGSFASVYKIDIIAGFQMLIEEPNIDGTKILFARKELKTRRSGGSLSAFQREKHVLELLGLVRHRHIIPLLTSYVYGDRFNMIFPLADGDLESLLSGNGSGFLIKGDGLWMQVLGLTSALHQLHNFESIGHDGFSFAKIGYHHDLKPQNILIRGNLFLLADFGLARLKDAADDSSTDHKYGALTYGAPETQQHVTNRRVRVSRALDIWSWGCILIEIITFELLGPDGVNNFRDYRKTETGMRIDHYFHDMKRMKPEVEQWLQYLQRFYLNGGNVSRGNMVGKVIAIIKKMLSTMPADRPSATVILHGLFLCLRDEEMPIDEMDEIFKDIKNETHLRDFYGTHSDEPLRIDPNAELPRPGLGYRGNAEQIIDMLENLGEFFDNNHPVMRTLAHSIDDKMIPEGMYKRAPRGAKIDKCC